MSRRRRRPSFDSKEFANVLESAGQEILLALERATRGPGHHPTKGEIRETGLREFLRQLLPERFYVGTGFIFDAADRSSRQLDIVVALEPPLSRVFERDAICYLPCEVALATIEVKASLNRKDLTRTIANAGSVRELRPFGVEKFISARKGGAPIGGEEHRVFYSVIAFTSDLAHDDWMKQEWVRLKGVAADASQPMDVIDRVVVLDRGQINVADARAQTVIDSPTTVASLWFIHLWNHLEREAARRKMLDPDIYVPGGKWRSLG